MIMKKKPSLPGIVQIQFVGGYLDGKSCPQYPPLPIRHRYLVASYGGPPVTYIIRTLPKNGVQFADFEPEIISAKPPKVRKSPL